MRSEPKPSDPVCQTRRRREVEPLRIVDRDEHGLSFGERSERIHDCDAKRARVDWRPLVVAEYQRARQRLTLYRGSGRSASSSTASSRSPMPAYDKVISLSTGWACSTVSPRSCACSTAARQSVVFPIPASPSSTSAVTTGHDSFEEVVKGRQLGIPPYDEGEHGRPIVRLRDTGVMAISILHASALGHISLPQLEAHRAVSLGHKSEPSAQIGRIEQQTGVTGAVSTAY